MALESNIYALYASKQTAKGSPATTATRMFNQVAGDMNVARADGSENFSNMDRFGNQADFTDTLIGEGSPGIQATPTEASWLLWIFFGNDTVTGSADPWQHVFVPSANGGYWSTFWAQVGSTVTRKQKFSDCRIGSLALEGSSGQKVVRATPTIMSLDPGEIFTTAPTGASQTTEVPYLYTEGMGTYNVNGTVLRGHSQFSLTWDEALSPYYGDDVVAIDLITGTPSVAIGATILVDSAGAQEYYKRLYNTGTPTATTKPIHVPEALGSYQFTLTQKTASGNRTPARTMLVEVPGVKWAPDLSIPASPDGGAVELALGGSARITASNPLTRITTQIGNAAFTA